MLATALATSCGAGASPELGSPTGPSVILVSVDTLRADHLGCYGYPKETSPFLDRIADEAVVFEETMAASCRTATSHMSMFSGLHPGVHGVRNSFERDVQAASPQLPWLPALLREAGYHTAAFTGGGMMSGEFGFARGFDVYDDKGEGAARVVDRADRWLRRYADGGGDRPFFLFVHTYEVHEPYTAPPDWQARWVSPDYGGNIDSTRCELPENASEVWKEDKGFYEEILNRFWRGFDRRDAADVQHMVDLYDACIAFTDHELERLWRTVEELGLADDVLLIVTSDHGEEFMEHGKTSHDSIYQEVLRVPLIVRMPGKSHTRRIGRPVQGIDLAASIAELCDLSFPVETQGSSWASDVMGGFGENDRTWSELGWPPETAALRWGRHKLVVDRTAKSFELYDLKADPGEHSDLAGAPPDDLLARMGQAARELHVDNAKLSKRWPTVSVRLGDRALGVINALGYGGDDAEEEEDDEPPE
ncbi:MAG: sulfatase [Planctomycetota bacterium]|nr:sulfatase [Planctomycetota bacterium]